MRHYLARGIPAGQAAGLVHRVQTAAVDASPGVPPGDVRKALRVLRDSLERFDDGPADRTLEPLLGVFATGAVLRDVALPYPRGVGERWACGEATIARQHFASKFLEGWMHTMARGWNRSGPYRAVLAWFTAARNRNGRALVSAVRASARPLDTGFARREAHVHAGARLALNNR